jgi:tRNA(adenine34) deaminase
MSHTSVEGTIDAVDHAMMERCIALAIRAMDHGEYPYAAVVCRNGEIVCESINSVRHDRDVSHHAEMIAISEPLRRLNRVSLEDCTIYANAEPCALCCYALRETRIGRVVFGVPAPLTGGVTRWNILTDTKLSDTVPEVFAPQQLDGEAPNGAGLTTADRYPADYPVSLREPPAGLLFSPTT